MKTYHKEKCQSVIRLTIKLNDNITIIMAGRYAFEYSVTIKRPENIKSMTFKNRNAALNEVALLKKQYRQFGDVCLRY